MRFAVITDIHGNAPALKAALREIDKQDVNQIYCLGDLIAIGPFTNEVLDILFSRADMTMITGNHDEAVVAVFKGEKHPKGHPHVLEHHQWIADRIEPTFVPKLEQLPRVHDEKLLGHSIKFIHYHIKPNKLNAHISDDPFHPIYKNDLKSMEDLFKSYENDLICFGHHHPTHYFIGDQTIYLNPGSLGCHEHSTARYAIVDVTPQSIDVTLKEADYDNTDFLLSYKKLSVPGREFILNAFHGGQLNK